VVLYGMTLPEKKFYIILKLFYLSILI